MKLRKKFTSSVAAAVLAFAATQAPVAIADETAFPQDQDNTTTITNSAVTLDPRVSVAAIAGMGAFYGAFCLLAARRRLKGAWFRAAAGVPIALTLLNPEVVEEQREPLPSEVAIVVDQSASQLLSERAQETQAMYQDLYSKLSALNGVNVRTITIGNETEHADKGTQLFSALESGLRDVTGDRLGAVIVLSDGQIHDIPGQLPARLKGKDHKTPLHALISGKKGEFDRKIIIERSPRFGFVEEEQAIVFRVSEVGDKAKNAPVQVTASSEGSVLTTVTVMPGEETEVRLKLPHAGTNVIVLEASSLEGELTDINNRVLTSIEAVRESMSVLLVSGAPNAGVKMWRGLFKSDPDADLVHFMISRPPEKQDSTPLKELSLVPVPTNEIFSAKGIENFDLVVFDHYEYRGVLSPVYFQRIADHVKDGGALLVVSGSEFSGDGSLSNTPLSTVLPAKNSGDRVEKPYKPVVTPVGERHPVTRNLPGMEGDEPQWGRWFSLAGAEVREGDTLMNGADDKPLLILSRKDEGRVSMLQSDQAWLWSRGYEGGGPYAELLSQTIRWLMKDPAMEEESLRMTRQGDTLVIERQTLQAESVPVTLHAPSGKTETLELEEYAPGLWRAEYPADELGVYSASLEGDDNPSAYLNVESETLKEYADAVSTEGLIAPVVRQSGGHISRMVDESGNLNVPAVTLLRGDETRVPDGEADGIYVRASDASILKGTSKTPLIPPWLSLIMTIGLMAAAYYRQSEMALFKRQGEKTEPEPKASPPRAGGPS